MLSRKSYTIINLILFFFWLIVAGALIVYATANFKVTGLDAFIYSFTGLLVIYFLTVFIHEIGHILFAKFCGLKTAYVNFGLFAIDYTEGKKVKFFSRIALEGGESAFLPRKEFTRVKLKLTALGGLLFTLLFAVALNVPMFVSKNVFAFCFLTIGSCSAFYLFTVNILPLDKTSDGSILLTKRDYNDVIVAITNLQNKLDFEDIPAEDVIFKKSNEPLAVFYHFMYLTLQNRREEGVYCLTSLQSDFSLLTDQEYTLIFPELLYLACTKGKPDEEYLKRAEIFFIDEAQTPSVIRAHCAYRKFLGDKEWTKILYDSYKRAVASSPNFIKAFESQIDFSLESKK